MTDPEYAGLYSLVRRVRGRWRMMTALRALARALAAGAIVLGIALLSHWYLQPRSAALVLLWVPSVALAAGAVVAAVAGVLRQRPRVLQVARFIEERCPELDDALVTALAHRDGDPRLMAAVVHDAANRTRRIEIDSIISGGALRRAAASAAAALVLYGALGGMSAEPAAQAGRVLAVYMFPERLQLEVAPGDVTVRAGESLEVSVRVSGSGAIVPVLRTDAGGEWRDTPMEQGPDGFTVSVSAIDRDFRYTVAAAGVSSRQYGVTVVHPPRVDRIDLRYDYPAGFGMPPRDETDGGDIYGPAGTRVRITVHPSKPVRRAVLTLAGADPVELSVAGDVLEGDLTIAEDGSYRVALADADGLTNPGDTEYFIRTLQDRPPDVRIVRPARDRQVISVEEVLIEARAEDDFGIAAFELVVAVGGGPEKVLPFSRSGSATAMAGERTLYLEDLDVRPGDAIAYYARARDVSRGKHSTEARSDIFFLEVTPFEEEFVASQSEGMAGGGGDGRALEALIQAQKDLITATWNLDRRSRESGGRSNDDIRTVAHGQRDLHVRASAALGEMQRASDIRRRRLAGRAGGANGGTDAMVEAVGRAVKAMAGAYGELEGLSTAAALPHELTALNELLRAQAEVRRREIQQQQANGTGGPGSNRRQQDLSSLFDRELARQQQTNYETPPGTEARERENRPDEALERVADLARRQDELSRGQEELARKADALPREELRRELERLTREQSELRREAEELARELQQRSSSQGGRGDGGSGGSAGEQQQASRELQQASEDMQGAASELRRDNPGQASARGSRAAERLRDLEHRMGRAQPDDRRRAIGELQLESRQLAEAQRRLGGPAGASGTDAADQARRRALEQERLAERAERLEQGVRRLAEGGASAEARQRSALNDAAQEVERLRLSDRMRAAAREDRRSPGDARGGSREISAATPGGNTVASPREREEIARGLDRVADRLGASSGGRSEAAEQLTEELSRVRRQREELAALDRQLAEMRASAAGQPAPGRGGRGEGAGTTGQNGGTEPPWREVRELLTELQRQDRELVPAEADGFNPGRSAPGTEAWKQDFAEWESLKVQVSAALERVERTLADGLRGQEARDKLSTGASQAVPEQYRRLVEQYFRALASEDNRR